MAKEYLPVRTSKLRCFLLVGLVFLLYLLDNPYVISIVNIHLFNYILKPIAWIGVGLVVLSYPKIQFAGKLKAKEFVNGWAINFAIIYIVILVLCGLFIEGLGKSPYDHSAIGIIKNIWSVFSVLITKELVRSYLINSWTKEESYIALIAVTLLITLINIPWVKILELEGLESIVKFSAQTLLPQFSKNFFATYLALLGGPIPATIYIGILEGFTWLSPVLPNLKWITTALIGILVPIFSLTFLQDLYGKESKLFSKRDPEEKPLSWIITCIVSISIIWFSVGVFPIYPSVIATGSMEPMIMPGDVILVQKIKSVEKLSSQLKIGDVIQFRKDKILISHRIIDIVVKDDHKYYRTKGDNNSVEDPDLVETEQVKGLVTNVIPKVGWLTLLIKRTDNIPLEKVVF